MAEFLWKLLPLIGYFLLAAAAGVCHTYLEISAGLNADAGLLNWVYLIYMDLLYCYLAAALHGWKRWVLLSGARSIFAFCAEELLRRCRCSQCSGRLARHRPVSSGSGAASVLP